MAHSNDNDARHAAIDIWQAGVDAVRSERLIADQVAVDSDSLTIKGKRISLRTVGNICIVGAGKAAGYLAKALEAALEPLVAQHGIEGWLNVPADCLVSTKRVKLHAARPAGVNEPRPEGVVGAEKIRSMVAALQPSDLAICLLTGGGSALLPAPVSAITLDDKLQITRLLSAAGANIRDLNKVRIALSSIKGGGLARACRAQQMLTLIISDVIGDPLELIASGPTVATQVRREEALEILTSYVDSERIPAAVLRHLKSASESVPPWQCTVSNTILANNATAVMAAAAEATSRGFRVEIIDPEDAHTSAEEVGRALADRLAASRNPRSCLIWGGEPVVTLAPEDRRGKGGRNQQLVLAALQHWSTSHGKFPPSACILSGGTDGEDGPTDAAGAFVDSTIFADAQLRNVATEEFLERNDAYTFFQQLDGLLKTGPTHTNVCDLRIALKCE